MKKGNVRVHVDVEISKLVDVRPDTEEAIIRRHEPRLVLESRRLRKLALHRIAASFSAI